MTASTSAPARLVRSSSSRATKRARSTARTSLSAVPERQKGVRQPATIATRRPFPAGITFFSALTERNGILTPHACQGPHGDGGRAGGRARRRRRDYRRRDRARRGAARLSHGGGGQ